MNTKHSEQPERRILARQLARPLTEEEKQIVTGGMIAQGGAVAVSQRLADTWSCTGCPASDCDS